MASVHATGISAPITVMHIADSDRTFEVERRLRWPENGNLPSTIKFVELVKIASNLIGILTGHTHRAQVDTL